MPLLPGKANIGRNIEIEQAHGKPRKQAVAIALNVARKSGVRIQPQGRPLRIKNAPLFEDGTKEPGWTGADRWTEPLLGPSERTVGNPPGEMANLESFYQNRQGTPDLTPPFPAPLQESDFPDKSEFSAGTTDHLDPGGL